MSSMFEIGSQWHTCGYCYAVIFGSAPVHGVGEPCPFKVAESLAYVEMLEAQKANYIGTGFMTTDMAEMMKRLFPGVEGEDP